VRPAEDGLDGRFPYEKEPFSHVTLEQLFGRLKVSTHFLKGYFRPLPPLRASLTRNFQKYPRWIILLKNDPFPDPSEPQGWQQCLAAHPPPAETTRPLLRSLKALGSRRKKATNGPEKRISGPRHRRRLMGSDASSGRSFFLTQLPRIIDFRRKMPKILDECDRHSRSGAKRLRSRQWLLLAIRPGMSAATEDSKKFPCFAGGGRRKFLNRS